MKTKDIYNFKRQLLESLSIDTVSTVTVLELLNLRNYISEFITSWEIYNLDKLKASKKKKMKLHNRDGANLELVKISTRPDNSEVWKLKVDTDHDYVLQYIRIIGKEGASTMKSPNDWEAIDPSGGPFISIGSIIDNQYKVVGFLDATTLILRNEGDNDK